MRPPMTLRGIEEIPLRTVVSGFSRTAIIVSYSWLDPEVFIMAAKLAVTFTGLRFDNPFLLASAPPTESDTNIMRAFDAGWGGVVTKTIGLHPVDNVAGPKTKFLRATPDSTH